MKKDRNIVFLIVMLALCSLVQIDADIYDMDIKTVLVTVGVLLFLAAKLMTDRGFEDVRTDNIDIAVYVSGVIALAGMLYKVVLAPGEYGEYMTLLSLCLLYFAVRNYMGDICPDLIFLVSIFGAVISIPLLYHYMIDAEFVMPVSALLQDGGILPWLVLMIAINVLGYCIYDGKAIWYGANAIVGFFLLLIQNNAAAVIIAGAMFLQTALRYMTRKKLVRRVTQMFFAYVFLLCNMALITNYTELLEVELSYDLESSVYIELMFAVFGIWFFNIWDKSTNESDEEDMVLPQFRGFFKQISMIAMIFLMVIAAAVVRGRTDILPDAFGRLIALCRQGVESQTGILEAAAARYGIFGVILMGYFLYSVLETLRKNRLSRTSRHRKLFRIVSWTFVVQALFLTQSMTSMPLYIIFVAVMLNEQHVMNREMPERLQECNRNNQNISEQRKGENADEADHSDSVLQRGGNFGNRIKRFAQTAGRHRPD